MRDAREFGLFHVILHLHALHRMSLMKNQQRLLLLITASLLLRAQICRQHLKL